MIFKVFKQKIPKMEILFNGAPEGIRTPGLCLRRAALYPAELRAQAVSVWITLKHERLYFATKVAYFSYLIYKYMFK